MKQEERGKEGKRKKEGNEIYTVHTETETASDKKSM